MDSVKRGSQGRGVRGSVGATCNNMNELARRAGRGASRGGSTQQVAHRRQSSKVANKADEEKLKKYGSDCSPGLKKSRQTHKKEDVGFRRAGLLLYPPRIPPLPACDSDKVLQHSAGGASVAGSTLRRFHGARMMID